MNPIIEAILFLLKNHEKHAAHPDTAAKAARIAAEIRAEAARYEAIDPEFDEEPGK